MPRHLITHERMASRLVSPVGETAGPSLRVRFPTHNRDSLGTVLSETVATVTLSVPSTITCRKQLAHSGTAGTI